MDNTTFAPIEINLYDENDEKVNTLTKSVVRWGMMKQAIKLAKMLGDEGNTISDVAFDALTAFICRLFDDKVSPSELENGADITEMMAAFKSVMRRASAMGNV